MAEIRPFRGLHYAEPDVSRFLCPPYDVISPAEQRRLCDGSPHNIIRLEYGEAGTQDTPADNRYTRAAAALRQWQQESVLVRDAADAFYVYDQEFTSRGEALRRRSLFARVRLQDWDEGSVRPHERTLDLPKEDRLKLLRACRLNISPILALYRDEDGQVQNTIEAALEKAALLETAETNGERHRVSRITDEGTLRTISRLFADKTAYVIDGHHRYETALNYRKERQAQASAWSGEEPENFVLIALTAREDDGLVVLPTHRLLRDVAPPADFLQRLGEVFSLEDVSAATQGDNGGQRMEGLLVLASAGGIVIGLADGAGRRFILHAKAEAVAAHMSAGTPASWRSLDAAVLQEVILQGILGIDQQTAHAAGRLEFSHDGAEALRAVASGRCSLAFLLNATPTETVLAVADAGERMPQKSTFFYPKLPTGLVMNLLD